MAHLSIPPPVSSLDLGPCVEHCAGAEADAGISDITDIGESKVPSCMSTEGDAGTCCKYALKFCTEAATTLDIDGDDVGPYDCGGP